MHAGKPDLREAFGIDRAELLLFRPFVPGDRVEGPPLVIERQGVPRMLHTLQQRGVLELHRPDPLVDRDRELVDRKPIGRDRVPQTYKMDLDVLAPRYFLVRDAAGEGLPQGEQDVADPTSERDPKDPPGLHGKGLPAEG